MLAAVWAALPLQQLQAQQPTTYTLSGQVLDPEGQPVAAERIRVAGQDQVRLTNLEGAFEFELEPGQHVLVVEAYSYNVQRDTLNVTDSNITGYVIQLSDLESNMAEVVITAEYNPALRIIRKVIDNKKNTRMSQFDAYEYESYNKLVVTLDNISDEKMQSRLLKPTRSFVEAYRNDPALQDTSDSSKIKLTGFISETVSQVFYKKPRRKEVIKAQRESGIEIPQTSLLGSTLLTTVDIYDNQVDILGTQFTSPVSRGAFVVYNYELEDFEVNPEDPEDTLYTVRVIPKTQTDKLFRGRLYIRSKEWVMQRVDLRLNEGLVLNYVEDIILRVEYKKVDTNWVISLSDITSDFKNKEDKIGLMARAVSVMYDHKLNQPYPDKFYKQEDIEIRPDAQYKSEAYWQKARKTRLERSEKLGYALVDTLKQKPIWKFYKFFLDFFTTNRLEVGKVQLGPYLNLLSFNPVEGFRVQLGMYTTPKFSDRISVGGHVAYGFGDDRFKYDLDLRYKLIKKPRVEIGIQRSQDVEQVGFRNYKVDGTGLLYSALMRVPLFQMNYYVENNFNFYVDAARNLSFQGYLRNKSFEPAFALTYNEEGPSGDNLLRSGFQFTEFGLSMRLSFKERYVLKNYEKVYLGSKYPKFWLEFRQGFDNFLGGEYNYTNLSLAASDKMQLGILGYMNYTAQVGKIWGTLPYPLLYVFRGNQSYAFDPNGTNFASLRALIGARNRTQLYDPTSFNLMYFYEFIADFYAVLAIDHHFDGLLLRRIPGIKKLNLKEVLTFRLGYGTLTDANRAKNTTAQQRIEAPDDIPYMELGFGIENIFKVMRVDCIWRLTYQDPQAPGRLARYQYNWGIRVNVALNM